MDYSSLLCCVLLTCAGLLLFGVISVQSAPLPPIKWKLLSHSTGRFVVLHPTGEVDADGPDMDISDVYVHFLSRDDVQIVSATSPPLVLGINSATGELLATPTTDPEQNIDASIINVFRVVRTLGQFYLFYLSVDITVPCATEEELEGSGVYLAEADSCSVTKECAVAFDSVTKRPIKCQEQDAISDTAKSLTFVFTVPTF